MSFDGWSNVRNEPILASCVTTDNGDVYLVDTIDTSGTQQTSENLLLFAKDAIKKTEEEFGCQVLNFVSDSCFAMQKMHKMLATQSADDDNTHLIMSYGCNNHYLNLLVKDISALHNNDRIIGVSKKR